jgi:hypothetical protein
MSRWIGLALRAQVDVVVLLVRMLLLLELVLVLLGGGGDVGVLVGEDAYDAGGEWVIVLLSSLTM